MQNGVIFYEGSPLNLKTTPQNDPFLQLIPAPKQDTIFSLEIKARFYAFLISRILILAILAVY